MSYRWWRGSGSWTDGFLQWTLLGEGLQAASHKFYISVILDLGFSYEKQKTEYKQYYLEIGILSDMADVRQRCD